jgi:ABC-type antimicrobial peptide transport system permease subunit
VLSNTLAQALFGEDNPVNQIVRVDNKRNLKVTGVYEDFPANSSFQDYAYLLPWQQLVSDQEWVDRAENNWTLNAFETLVKLSPNTDFERVSSKITLAKARHAPDEAKFNPRLLLHPMSQWHLQADWENGVPVRGRIQFVWLFGSIGAFVLLLACINFMNLSTAHSQKRAKEVGVRKAVGSLRNQLITQFLVESFLIVALALILFIGIAGLALPWFNTITGKQMFIPWTNAWF